MKEMLAKSLHCVKTVVDIKQRCTETIDVRAACLRELKTNADNISQWMESAEMTAQVRLRMEDTLVRIRARRTTRMKAIAVKVRQEQPLPASLQQQTAEFIIANYTTLLSLINSVAQKGDLDIEAITRDFNNFKSLNDQLIRCDDDLEEARGERTYYLYDVDAGIVKISSDVKEYIHKVFGYSSPEYKRMAAIKFRTIMGD
jgi:hypothetical protein